MKKKFTLILLLCTVALVLSSCVTSFVKEKIEKPQDTELEYWLFERPNKKEWTELSGGKYIYIAEGYEPIVNENGEIDAPEYCVLYYTGNFPLWDFGIKRINGVKITDPEVSIWELTINSTREDVLEFAEQNGFSVTYEDSKSLIVNKERYKLKICYNEELTFSYHQNSIIEEIFTFEFK